jgi:hypothetical protein
MLPVREDAGRWRGREAARDVAHDGSPVVRLSRKILLAAHA